MPKERKIPEMRLGAVYMPYHGGRAGQKFKIDDAIKDKIERIRARLQKG